MLQQAKLRQEEFDNVKMKLSVRMADRQGSCGREVKEKCLARRIQLWNHAYENFVIMLVPLSTENVKKSQFILCESEAMLRSPWDQMTWEPEETKCTNLNFT